MKTPYFLLATGLVLTASTTQALDAGTYLPYLQRVIGQARQHDISSSSTPNSTLVSKVVDVSDGDTIVVFDPENGKLRIRLASIDAPETGHGRCRPGQDFGERSRQALAKILAGQQVQLKCYEQDHHGRAVCDAYPIQRGAADTTSANLRMVNQGMAWANTSANGRYLRSTDYISAEQQARSQRLGIWSVGSEAMAPWEWRSSQWDKGDCRKG